MSGTVWIIIWWAAFGLSHMLISEYRSALVDRLGRQLYLLFYSAVAFATFIPLVMVYTDNRHAGGLLWAVPNWLLYTAMLISLLGIAMVLPSLIRPSPVGMVPGAGPEARGLLRITRHPLFMGLALWGLGHALVNGFVADVLFFGGFVAFGLIGCAHQDARKRREEGERLGEFYRQTSLLPFAAILTGRNRLALRELPWITLTLGIVLAFVLYALHPMMFS